MSKQHCHKRNRLSHNTRARYRRYVVVLMTAVGTLLAATITPLAAAPAFAAPLPHGGHGGYATGPGGSGGDGGSGGSGGAGGRGGAGGSGGAGGRGGQPGQGDFAAAQPQEGPVGRRQVTSEKPRPGAR